MFTKNPRFKAMLCTVPFAFGSAELMANEEDTICEDWTLRQSGQWLSCTFQDQNIDRDLVNFFLEQSRERNQAATVEFITSRMGVIGDILAFFTLEPKPNGQSEIQKATNLILDAIQVSQQQIVEDINLIFIGRDFADLASFKLRVQSYMLNSNAVRQNNIQELQNLWNTAVELRHYFETHTFQLGVGKTISSYHAYIGIVALELTLRGQLTVYNYIATGEEHLIESQLQQQYALELTNVFNYVNDIDWRAGAESLFTTSAESAQYFNHGTLIDRLGGSCISVAGISLNYDANKYTLISTCSIESGLCHNQYNHDFDGNTIFDNHPYLDNRPLTGTLVSELQNHNYFNLPSLSCNYSNPADSYDFQHPVHSTNMLNSMSNIVRDQILVDAYDSTRSILDSWWYLAGNSGDRPKNSADLILDEIRPPLPKRDDFSGEPVFSNTHSYQWLTTTDSTPSHSTGPTQGSGAFAFLETSRGYAYNAGNTAALESPMFEANDKHVVFDYHMYGSNMGNLALDVYHNGSWVLNHWRRKGQQHSSGGLFWFDTAVDLSDFSGPLKIRLRGEAAGGYHGDMAIDSIEFRHGPAPKPSIKEANLMSGDWFYLAWLPTTTASEYTVFVIGDKTTGERRFLSKYICGSQGGSAQAGYYRYTHFSRSQMCNEFGPGTYTLGGQIWNGTDSSMGESVNNVGTLTCQ
jgi:hypothetical protein